MIKIKENYKENRARYDEILKSVTNGLSIGGIHQDYGMGYREISIEPTDKAINKVISKAKSKGFREVHKYYDEKDGSDSWVVLIYEDNDGRVVLGIIFNKDEARVNCGYSEEEDAEWFE